MSSVHSFLSCRSAFARCRWLLLGIVFLSLLLLVDSSAMAADGEDGLPADAVPAAHATSSAAATGGSVGAPSAQPRRIWNIEHDFGQVWAGQVVRHTFSIDNTSNRVLGILGVATTCGCTTTGRWERQAQPGETWSIEINLTTAGRKGAIRKTVTVKTDDPDRPEALLTLKGRIEPGFVISPAESVTFGELKEGEVSRRTLTIINNHTEPVTLTKATPSCMFIKATLHEVDKGRKYELAVETVPPLPGSIPLGHIVVETDWKDHPQIRLPINGNVQSPVALSPKVISVPQPVSKDMLRTLQLVANNGEQTQIIDVDSTNPAIQAVATTDGTRRIRLTIPKGTVLDEKGETITVFTDDEDHPELTCRIRPYHFGRARSREGSSDDASPTTQPVAGESPASQPGAPAGAR